MKRFRPVIIWAGITLGLIVLALLVPKPWVKKVEKTFDVKESPSAFAQSSIDAETNFDNSESVVVTTTNREELAWVAIRKLLKRGKLNKEEMNRAQTAILEALDRFSRSADGGEARVLRDLQEALVRVLPRLKPEDIQEETKSFWSKLNVAPAPGSGPTCANCHSQVRTLPDSKTFDAVGIYPGISSNQFRFGKAIPVLTESLEIDAALKLETPAPSKTACTDCHGSHESENFRVDKKMRADNLGFWMNIDSDPVPGMVDVEVKLKTFESAHRAPAGFPSRAYIATVEVFSDGTKIPMWHGSRLPEQISGEPGVVFARWMKDSDGKLTGDPAKAVTLDADTRLQTGRFSVDHFLFREPEEAGEIKVRAKLHYLPKFPTWDDAEVVIQVEKKR